MDEMDKIEAPVAMPRPVRRIATVLIGLPGALMWLVGLLATMASMVYTVFLPSAERPNLLIWLGASLAANLVGYSMFAAASWLNGSRHYRMPSRRLPAYVAMEILDQLLAAASVGFLAISAISLSFRAPAFPLLWVLATAAGSALLGFTSSWRVQRGDTWRHELLTGQEGAKPLY